MSISKEIIAKNKIVLKDILNRVANIAKTNITDKSIENAKERTVLAALDKIVGKLDVSRTIRDEVQIWLMTLYTVCYEERGFLAFMRRKLYVYEAMTRIMETLDMLE